MQIEFGNEMVAALPSGLAMETPRVELHWLEGVVT